ncbi:MAG TPA: AraC family transcriptional regulator [Abditibacteriaceae bacterium]
MTNESRHHPNAFAAIGARLAQLQRHASAIEFHAGSAWYLLSGMETRTDEGYDWHGLHRGGDAACPHLIFQLTLAGRGALEFDGANYDLRPGHAFAVIVPSDHRYFLPKGASWTFFWLTLQHPYIVPRLAAVLAETGPILPIEAQTRFMMRSITLWEEQFTGSDPLVREQLLFDWMFEFERFARGQLYPQAARDRWLDDVRRRIESSPSSPLDVSALAAAYGLSRSHYSHGFKAATGLSPAAWISYVRLDEAARRLVRSDAKLEAIARATGFGSAGRLSKVFRRRFGLSPGEFRKQMRT